MKKLILSPTMFSASRREFSGKVPWQVLLEECCKLKFKYINFCAHWNQCWGNAWTKLSLCHETLIKLFHKQAWIIIKNGSLRLVNV